MAEELDKPLLDPQNFIPDGIDLVTSPSIPLSTFLLHFQLQSGLTSYHRLQERIPLEQVFELLKTSPTGLSSDDAEARLQIFGPNKLEERKVRQLLPSYYHYAAFNSRNINSSVDDAGE